MTTNDFERAAPPLARALAARGYEEATPVQSAVMAPELDGCDLLVSAQTGSGKTVAFGMAMAPTLLGAVERFQPAADPLALVVAPTRELALQVRRELDWLYAETGMVTAICVGGMDPRAERRVLQGGVHTVVGTPGRLRDHITRNAFSCANVRVAVLDEADEMLDLGFREDLEFILDATPSERRTLLFSATVPAPIAKLARGYQRDAARVETQGAREQHADIEYQALPVVSHERENAIVNVLRYHEAPNALVFCNTRAAVQRITARFHNRGFSVVALSGELTQGERTNALQALRDGRAKVCIATDVAARGIDLAGLELVVHADLPSNAETLLHRSGRTGRAGRKGVSALIVDPRSRGKAERLLREAGVSAEWRHPPSAEEVRARDDERMLADPVLTESASQDEREATAKLLARFEPEQVAAAFLRMARRDRSAPEDLERVPLGGERRGRPETGAKAAPARNNFDGSVWLSLSVGRDQRAEPRWLIPMLCKAGDITKAAIGMIRMQKSVTYVELDAAEADAFLERVGPKRLLDRNVRLTVLEGKPEFESAPGGKPFKTGGKKPFEKKGGPPWKKSPGRKAEGGKPAGKKPSKSKKRTG